MHHHLYMPVDSGGIGKRMVAAYERAGLNRNQFARAGGFSYQQVMDWESGEKVPTLAMASKIADALGIAVSELLGEETRYESIEPKRPDPPGWDAYIAQYQPIYQLSPDLLEMLRNARYIDGKVDLETLAKSNIVLTKTSVLR